MKKILLIFALIFVLVGCSNKETSQETQTNQEANTEGAEMTLNQVEGFREGNIKATMHTNKGDIELILFPNVAPKAVENFTTHAKDGYYDGLTFHRVIEGFMIQGGDPEGTGAGGESIWGKPFEDEFDVNYRHFTGALSMANAGPSTNGSQFFIVTATHNVGSDVIEQMKGFGAENGYPESVVAQYEKVGGTYHLDGRHTVFGQVVAGQDVAEAISKVDKDASDKPLEPVVIESIEIFE